MLQRLFSLLITYASNSTNETNNMMFNEGLGRTV